MNVPLLIAVFFLGYPQSGIHGQGKKVMKNCFWSLSGGINSNLIILYIDVQALKYAPLARSVCLVVLQCEHTNVDWQEYHSKTLDEQQKVSVDVAALHKNIHSHHLGIYCRWKRIKPS